jgi:hypothetical protein
MRSRRCTNSSNWATVVTGANWATVVTVDFLPLREARVTKMWRVSKFLVSRLCCVCEVDNFWRLGVTHVFHLWWVTQKFCTSKWTKICHCRLITCTVIHPFPFRQNCERNLCDLNLKISLSIQNVFRELSFGSLCF